MALTAVFFYLFAVLALASASMVIVAKNRSTPCCS